MMQKQLHRHPDVYAEARREILEHCDGKLPVLFDPFAGGGSIPLEANRLGFEAHAGDLNPVAVLLCKCSLELAPRWANRPPVNAEDRERIGGTEAWQGTHGLAADVRYYGRVILERARKQVGHLYPPVTVTKDMAEGRPDIKRYVGKKLPVIAWIWARTVASPNPAAQGKHVPLMSTFWLSSKKGKEVWLESIVDRTSGSWRFAVRAGAPPERSVVKAGTKTGRATFRCLLSTNTTTFGEDYIKREGQAARIGMRLVGIVAGGERKRVYLPATPEQEGAAVKYGPVREQQLEAELAQDPRNIWCTGYGLKTFAHLFTPRQLTAMVTLSDLVKDIREDVERDAKGAGLSGEEAAAYATSVTTFLALALDRCADFNNALSRWKPSGQQQMQLFGRQAIPMVWDFAEANLLGEKAICWHNAVDICAGAIETLGIEGMPVPQGHARQIDAATGADGLKNILVSTDPPYYDNIGYAALSDFFYVWLRRTIGDLYPDLFRTILVPKEPELTASPERFGGDKQRAKEHFESGFRRAFTALREKMDHRFPLTVYYAFKQDDEEGGVDDDEAGNGDSSTVDRTTGWETLLEALIGSGFQITATWPVRASQKWRMRAMGANALASYIVLACRPRLGDASLVTRREFLAALKSELPSALKHLQHGNIAPVDLAQAAIGPGMAIYSRYAKVVESDGSRMPVRIALQLINQVLDEVLTEQESEFDPETRWALSWFEQQGHNDGPFGDAEGLARAKNVSVNGLVEAGIVQSRGGRTRLLRREELAADWDPATDRRLTIWEATQYLIRTLEQQGEAAAAAMLKKLGGALADTARDLAYRLFTTCERKKWAQEALAYNGLVLAWPELTRLALEGSLSVPEQAGLFGGAEA